MTKMYLALRVLLSALYALTAMLPIAPWKVLWSHKRGNRPREVTQFKSLQLGSGRVKI